MKIMPGAVTVKKTTATEEKRNAMETNLGNKVQENEQELAPQDQIRAKEMAITVGKTTMTNVDYVGKRTAVIVLLFGTSTHIKRNCPWKKGRNIPIKSGCYPLTIQIVSRWSCF